MTKGKKQMTGTQRCRIEFGLAAGMSERTIAKEIGVSLSTVSREIRKHTYESFKGCYGRANQCVHRQDCRLTGVCGDCPAKGAPCVRCGYRNCSRFCDRVEYIDCSQRLLRTGKVCNGCPDERRCHRRKLFYVASRAQDDYRRILSESRQGAALETWERDYIDELVSPKIKAGQSVHHICVTNAAKLTRHERTIQRYGCYVGRAYVDYGAFLSDHPGVGPVYMDLLIGRIGGVCILTLHWLNAGFMIGILIPNKCAESVVAVFDRLYAELGPELFAKLFPVILTDRGTEFSYPSRIEECEDGTKRTRVFFCDPMNSNQKSQIERNHEIVREILPKGVSFDALTQEQAYLALSHVNAYVRYAQGDRTPYDVFEFLYGEGTAAKLHIAKIDPKEVVLKPRLVGIEMK